MTDSRKHEHEIEIDAPLAAVWRALTDADHLTGWYVEDAEIDAREGGRFWVSWGEGLEGTSRIEVFEPERRLRLAGLPPKDPPPDLVIPDLDEPIVEEFVLDAAGPDGPVVVRLVHSGIPRSADWDGFYDGTQRGWAAYMHWLKYYVEHHRGEQRSGPHIFVPVEDGDVAWEALTAGLRAGTLDGPGGPVVGDPLVWNPPTNTLVHITSPDDCLLSIAVERSDASAFAWVEVAGYGWTEEATADVEQRWRGWVHAKVGVDESAMR